VCAHKHSSDDDRQRPRGLGDALSRSDTEQGWMHSSPGRDADSTEHVPPPESTPARFSQPTGQRRPAPPPAVDSWDAVVSRDPQASRPADPWAPAAEPEQELWTPPGDTVYRRVHSGDSGLPERWPSPSGSATDPESGRGLAPDTGESTGAGPERDRPNWPASDTGEAESADGARRPSSAASDREPERTGWSGESAGRTITEEDQPTGDPSSSGWTASAWLNPRFAPGAASSDRRSSSKSTADGSERQDEIVLRSGTSSGSGGSQPDTAPDRDASAESDRRESDDLAKAMSRWSPDHSASDERELTDDEWLAHLKGEEPGQESTVDSTSGLPPWSAPDRPGAESVPQADSPAPLPPPAAGPQWTMGPSSGAHPVAAQNERPPHSSLDDSRADVGVPAPSGAESGADEATRVLRRPTFVDEQPTVAGRGSSAEASEQSSYGDRSTGILPAVGASGPRLGEKAGVTETDDTTRKWAAPTGGEPVEAPPAEPGPGRFSLPLPPPRSNDQRSPTTGSVPAADSDRPTYGTDRPAPPDHQQPRTTGSTLAADSDRPAYTAGRSGPPDPAYGEAFGAQDPAASSPRTPSSGVPAGADRFSGPASGTPGVSDRPHSPASSAPASQGVPGSRLGVHARGSGPGDPGGRGGSSGASSRQADDARGAAAGFGGRVGRVGGAGGATGREGSIGPGGARTPAGVGGPGRGTGPGTVGGRDGAPRAARSGGGPGNAPDSPGGQPPTVEELTAQSLLRERRPAPQTGWRHAVYTLTAHAVNPGQSPEDRRREELIARATVPVAGCYRIAVISLKGGVGKTTTTVTLGATLASLRGDRVIAVDANPDRGTLSGKIPLETVATVRNLLNDVNMIQHYFDVRRYTSQSADRLEVLASESDPAVSTAFSEADYRTVAAVLERFYNIVLTDCGTGLLHSAMGGVLDLADQIVLVSSGSVDGARSASATLDWLEAHGRGELVRNSVAVINSVRPKSGGVDLDRLEEHFAARCRAVARIPYDPHLEEGAEVDLGELSGASRSSLLELAAHVADAFPRLPRGPYGPGA